MFRGPARPPTFQAGYPDAQSSRMQTVSSLESAEGHGIGMVQPYSVKRRPMSRPTQGPVAPQKAPKTVMPSPVVKDRSATGNSGSKPPGSSVLPKTAAPPKISTATARRTNRVPRSGRRGRGAVSRRHSLTSSSSSSSSVSSSSRSSSSSSSSSDSSRDYRRPAHRRPYRGGRSARPAHAVPTTTYIPPDQMYVPSRQPFHAPPGPYINKNVAKYVQYSSIYGDSSDPKVLRMAPPVKVVEENRASVSLPNIISPNGGNPLISAKPVAPSPRAIKETRPEAPDPELRAFAGMGLYQQGPADDMLRAHQRQQLEAQMRGLREAQQQQYPAITVNPPIVAGLAPPPNLAGPPPGIQQPRAYAPTGQQAGPVSRAGGGPVYVPLGVHQSYVSHGPHGIRVSSTGPTGPHPAFRPQQQVTPQLTSNPRVDQSGDETPRKIGAQSPHRHQVRGVLAPDSEDTSISETDSGPARRVPDMELADTATYDSYDEPSVALSRAPSGIFLPDFRSRSRPGKKTAGCCDH